MKQEIDWPRYLKRKRLRTGAFSFYWTLHERDRAAGCPLRPEALGQEFHGAAQRARVLNEHLDAWREGQAIPKDRLEQERKGTVAWWHAEFFGSEAFRRLSARSQKDYREVLTNIGNISTSLTDAAGNAMPVKTLSVGSLTPAAVDKIYAKLRKAGTVTRRADLAIDIARRAWKVVSRLHPALFLVPMPGADGRIVPMAINPFHGVTRVRYDRDTAVPATRADALKFAAAAKAAGHPALGVAALICFEWHQRPEDVRRGRITWTDYRPAERPTKVRVIHHKTRRSVWKVLESRSGSGTRRLYPELEDAIAALPRLGVPLVMFKPVRGPKGEDGARLPRLYSEPYAQHLVQQIRKDARLPATFTLEACRHGGMTELGDSELTEQQVMTLSTHATPDAARLYVKRNERQEVAAANKRRDYVDRGLGENEQGAGVGTGRRAKVGTARRKSPK